MNDTSKPLSDSARRAVWLFPLFVAVALVHGLVLSSGATAADGEGTTVREVHAEGYQLDKQTSAWRTAVVGTDSITNLDTLPSTITPFAIANTAQRGGRTTLSASLRFSNSGAEATVYVAFYYYEKGTGVYHLLGVDRPYLGGSPSTITAGSAQDSSGNYLADSVIFDTYGATHAIVAISNLSAGTVDIWPGSY